MESELYNLCRHYSQFGYQSKRLANLDENIKEFNQIFASFLLALQLNSDCISFKNDLLISTSTVDPLHKDTVPEAFASDTPNVEELSSKLSSTTILGKEEPAESTISTTATVKHLKGAHESHSSTNVKVPSSKPKAAVSKKDPLLMILKKIIANLPLHLRDSSHTAEIECIVKYLLTKPNGEYINEIFTNCHLDKHLVMQHLNMLIRLGDVVKISKKGLLYQLNPEKYRI